MQLLMQPLMYTARILVACLLLLQLGTAPAHAAVKALVGGTVVDLAITVVIFSITFICVIRGDLPLTIISYKSFSIFIIITP